MWFFEELMKLIFLWIFVLLIIYCDAGNVVRWLPMKCSLILVIL